MNTLASSDEPKRSPSPGGPHAVDRDSHPRRCRGHVRSGAQCRAYAVEGMSVCRMHGGASPQARAAAARRRAEAEATVLLETVWDPSVAAVTDPVEALARLAGKTEHAVDVLGARVTSGELDGPTGIAFSKMIRELRQMLEGLERLGLEDRRVRINEQAGQMIAAMLHRALGRLGLTAEQQALAMVVVPEELKALAAGEAVQGGVER